MPHFPPQHCASLVHAALSAMQCIEEQLPPVHETVQHSVFAAHVSPGALHALELATHVFDAASQLDEQQSALFAHV
jgi:hypothetical protein